MKPNQQNSMLSTFRPPLVYELTGRQFTLVFDDGYDRKLVFQDRKTLSFGPEGEEKAYSYECLKAADRCYFVNFEDMSLRPRTGISLVLDLEQDLVTMILGHVYWNPKIPNMPSMDVVFGAIEREDGSVPFLRHGYTTDLVEKAVDWNYGAFDIAHVYATEHYYRVSFSPRGLARALKGRPELAQAKPGDRKPTQRDVYEDYLSVIRIRDRIYLVGLMESVKAKRGQGGDNVLALINLDHMHDVGRAFGANDRGDQNNTFGAFGVMHDASDVIAKPSTLYTR